MAQRSINRKRRIRRRLVNNSKDSPQKKLSEVQELRQRRTRRYQKRRAALRGSQLKPPPPSSTSQSRVMPAKSQKATVIGQTQRKQVRKRNRPSPSATQTVPVQRKLTHRHKHRASSVDRRHSRTYIRRKRASSLQMMRLLVAGVGVALVSGFAIALMHPEPLKQSGGKPDALQFQETSPSNTEAPVPPPAPSFERPGKELRQLKQELRNLVDQEPDLTTGLFFLNPETEEFVSHRGSDVFPAASMIKLPVLIAFFQDVDAGKIQLDEKLTMRPDLIASEAGAMQYDKPGSQYDALQTADWMITISDNTATNMIIDRVGGADVLNQRFQDWGLEHTKINQPLPDLEGTNTMSPKDLAILMAKVSQGDLLTAHSRDRALEILRHTVTKTLLPQGIGQSAQIAHKTGDIGMAVGDAGLIDMPNGQRYVAGVVVKRPHNDPRAQELIRAISKLTYKVFSERPVPRAKPAAAPISAGQSPQPQ